MDPYTVFYGYNAGGKNVAFIINNKEAKKTQHIKHLVFYFGISSFQREKKKNSGSFRFVFTFTPI